MNRVLAWGRWTLGRILPRPVKARVRRVLPASWLPPPAAKVRRFELRVPVLAPAAGDASPRATLRIEAPAGMYVPRVLEKTGFAGYEPDAIACFLAAIDLLGARTAFDIGANVGVFALVAAAVTDAEVVGFEPTPDLAAAFREIVKRNGLRCRVEPIALGATNGLATLHLSGATDSSNSLLAGFRPERGAVEVPVERLDDYCARTGLRPAVLKVDTEATEPDVFRGATGLLADDRPWIICEVLAGRTESELMEVFRPLGYRWYHITDATPLLGADVIRGDSTYRHLDWLFAPEPPPEAYWMRVAAWRAALAACGST